jgi:hypothetical protein
MEMKNSIATLENIWQFLKQQNIHLPYNPVITNYDTFVQWDTT